MRIADGKREDTRTFGICILAISSVRFDYCQSIPVWRTDVEVDIGIAITPIADSAFWSFRDLLRMTNGAIK